MKTNYGTIKLSVSNNGNECQKLKMCKALVFKNKFLASNSAVLEAIFFLPSNLLYSLKAALKCNC